MTALTQRRTRLTFETADCCRERGKLRQVVIDARPYLCLVRLKGMRLSFEISWAGIYIAAAKLAADKARSDRKTARQGKKTIKP